jgi:hypothetical protein
MKRRIVIVLVNWQRSAGALRLLMNLVVFWAAGALASIATPA